MKKRYFFTGMFSGIAMIVIVTILVVGMNNVIDTFKGIKTIHSEAMESLSGYENNVYPDFDSKVKDVMEKLDTYYLEGVDNQNAYEEAIRGLVSSIGDPYTTYFTKEEYSDFLEKMQGSYEGIGVTVSYGESEDIILVVAPFKDSPGEKAGMKPGDRIIKVDGEDIIGKSIDKVIEKIKGLKGTQVVITVLRGEEEIDIPVTRDVIEIPTIEYEMKENNIGYIAMSGFDRVTKKQFVDAIDDLESQGENGLIIDLRNNPGGYLDVVCAIVDRLVEKGNMIVYTEDKQGNREEYRTQSNKHFDKPLVILINGNSASASEILAGAVKDLGRGVLVGETSFGKGIVQSSFDLDDGSAIKITISKYYTPNGNYIHGVGIEPNYVVEYDSEYDGDNQLEKAIEVVTKMINGEIKDQ